MKNIKAGDIIILSAMAVVLIINMTIIILFAFTASPTDQYNQDIRKTLVVMIGTTVSQVVAIGIMLAGMKLNKNKDDEISA